MATEVPLTAAERRTVGRLRLRSQLITGGARAATGPPNGSAPSARAAAATTRGPGDVVRHLLAMQAQDFASAKWAIGRRSPGTTDADVDRELAAGTIVRSWPMRGTLHFVAPEDLRWMLGLTTERMLASAASRQRQLGLTPESLETARAAAVGALEGGRSLTRDELYGVFDRAGHSPEGQRGYHTLWFLAQTATLCLGGRSGRQQTFVLVDEWIPRSRTLEREEALGELALRYFRGHGPATVRDLAWWSSMTLTDARAGLAIARPALAELTLGGTEFFLDLGVLETDVPGGSPITAALPAFDEFLLGYGDRSAVLAPEHSARVVPGKNGLFQPVIVHGGAVVGTWRRTVTSRRVTVQPLPFAPLSARAGVAFARDAARLAEFLALPLELAT